MSRTARAQLQVVADPIADARAAHDRAQIATRAQGERLDAARAAEAQAVAAYDADDGKATEAAAARLAREKSERLVAAATAKETEALAALHALTRAADNVELDESIAYLEGFSGRLLPSIERLEHLREQVWQEREAIADLVHSAQSRHDHAAHLAERLERRVDVQRHARPTIADAALLVRVAIAMADKRAARDDVNGWLDAQGPEHVAFDPRELPAIEAATRVIEALKGQR